MKDSRELFNWISPEQGALAVELWDTLGDGGLRKEEEDSAERDVRLGVLVDLLTSFFFDITGDQPFQNGLIQFLAVLGIDRNMNRLRTAKNYSYILAGVVYCIRVLSVEKLLSSACREEQPDKDRERFLEYKEKYLADGSYSPMSEALSLLAYGKYIGLAAGNSVNAYWSRDKKTFYLHGRPIHLSRFRTMAQDLVAEAEHVLWEDLLWVRGVEGRLPSSWSSLLTTSRSNDEACPLCSIATMVSTGSWSG